MLAIPTLHASLVHATSNACLADRHGQIYVRILLTVLTFRLAQSLVLWSGAGGGQEAIGKFT